MESNFVVNREDEFIEMDEKTKQSLIDGAPFISTDFHSVNGNYILFFEDLSDEAKKALKILLHIKL